eukprot:gnl/TRDRNA2_/TRDRNA2_136476_c0_seq2.p2 gnl/TRDRNA2_/TRDRNA2_136476_c0~~gnl/TRDRNA2_/TRDRNA2_136476_c0_seq2.p2  ORF type:complete len:166 (+),score=34.66 gnl/TRDRNA2_/TRDRNA2_136476_c0_seq2:27-524(+)
MEWADGRKYEGQYFNDRKEGTGSFIWNDGRRFVGSWKDGKQHGVGIYSDKVEDLKVGEWTDGKRVRWLRHEEAEEFASQLLVRSERLAVGLEVEPPLAAFPATAAVPTLSDPLDPVEEIPLGRLMPNVTPTVRGSGGLRLDKFDNFEIVPSPPEEDEDDAWAVVK